MFFKVQYSGRDSTLMCKCSVQLCAIAAQPGQTEESVTCIASGPKW